MIGAETEYFVEDQEQPIFKAKDYVSFFEVAENKDCALIQYQTKLKFIQTEIKQYQNQTNIS